MLSERTKVHGTTGDEMLKLKCATEVHIALERQLSRMGFFIKPKEGDAIRLEGAVITNLGCEGEFVSVDNDLRKTGGAVSVETISSRHIVARNKMHVKERWEKLSKLERKGQWNWAKNSKEAKKVMEMEKEFNDRLQGLNKLTIQAKIEKKRKEDIKLMEALDECKKHGGPVTLTDIDKLDHMTDDQVKAEASYYKKIMDGGSAIRFKHKVGNKFEVFTIEELRQQIRNVIQPAGETVQDIDELLKVALKIDYQPAQINAVSEESTETINDTGLLAWWTGPLGQRKIGAVMNDKSLQTSTLKRYGFIPDLLLELKCDWKIEEVIENFHYEEIGGRVLLIIEDDL